MHRPRHFEGRTAWMSTQGLTELVHKCKKNFQSDRCSEVEDFCKAFSVAEFIAITTTHGFIIIFHVKGDKKKRKKKQLSPSLDKRVKYKNTPKQMTAF